jgi:glycosyltransferase involved in cell wall biosynthesis
MIEKQIAVISPAKFPGRTGDATHYWEIINQLIVEGFKVVLVCPKNEDPEEMVTPHNLEIIRVPYQPPRLHQISGSFKTKHYIQVLFFLLLESLTVFYILKSKRIKHVIVRHSVLTMQLPLIFRLLKVRAIADGETIVDLFKGKINTKLLNLIKNYEKKMIGIYAYYKSSSETQGQKLQEYGIPKDRILIIPVTININKIPKFPIEEIPEHTFGYFGVIERRQGVDILLNAFELILKKIPSAILFILGEGALKDELKEFVLRKNLSQNVIFDSVSREVLLNEYFKKFRIVVIPRPKQSDSTDHILPIKMIESLAAGKPTIVFDIPVMKEFSRETVVVVPSSDPESLANAMEELSLDVSKMKDYAEAAHELSIRYDIGTNIKKLINALLGTDLMPRQNRQSKNKNNNKVDGMI